MPRDGYYLPSRRLVNQDDAAIVQSPGVPRSRFIGSWTRKTAFDAGYLVPFMIDELVPGDHMKYQVTAYVRLSTPLFPMFDSQRVDTFFFFVPARILWDKWVTMMGEQLNPASTIAVTVPQISVPSTSPVGSIYDHFGIPVVGQLSSNFSINALPLRAYNLIYNQWFRDENIINSVNTNVNSDGPDDAAHYTLLKRAKSHDYFTSALPWPQKFTAPTVPLLGNAPITGIGKPSSAASGIGTGVGVWETEDAFASPTTYDNPASTTLATPGGTAATNEMMFKLVEYEANKWRPAIYADLTAATGVAINTLRQAWLVQSLLERDARGGTRYVELIRSHFGVTNPDFRLQRPEYIGGGQSPLNITPIAQTAPTDDAPLGALGAAGTSAGQHRASYAATEHGYVIGLINIRSELSYQQGVQRLWTRQSRYDFYWPMLANLGEQAILRQEIYATGVGADDTTVFGYQERWHELRTKTSEVTGIMRSQATGTLDGWHLAQHFATPPTLSQTFIEDSPDMERVLAGGELTTDQQYLADIQINRVAVRPLPTFGTPVALGRF